MKEALVTYGVRASDDEPGMDPPITVVMDSDSDEARSPICWNMVFQEEQPKPADKPAAGQPGFQFKPPQKAQLDWRRFWGSDSDLSVSLRGPQPRDQGECRFSRCCTIN